MPHWYDSLREVRSKGSSAERPGSLAGLSAARQIHQGQFFTPDGVAKLMWRIAQPAMLPMTRKLSVLDNSVGSGRLLQCADPQKHTLFGVDVDADALAALGKAAEAAGFECEFEACGLESVAPRHMDVAFINPPFSLNLQAPTLKPYACTCFGRFGPGSSALSHAYALAQAIDAATLVVALLPSSFAAEVAANPEAVLDADAAERLAAHIELPGGLFREENTDVRVSLLVFDGRKASGLRHLKLKTLDDPLPSLSLTLGRYPAEPKLARYDVEDEGPSITLPVTGDTTVRVVHDGRQLGLRFKCGLTQAKVENAVLREPVEKKSGDTYHRYPKGVRFEGQGQLDVEVHLAQPDPLASFRSLLAVIERAGGKLDVDPGVWGYLRRRMRQHQRQATPLRHTVWVKPGTAAEVDDLTGKARRDHVANPKVWGSPVIKAGTEIRFTRGADGHFDFDLNGKEFRLTAEDLRERFEVVDGAKETGWTVVHEGLLAKFPAEAHALRLRAIKLGIDQWLTWQFQFDDLLELMLKPVGTIAAWEMGLGKARLASALILLSGTKHGLITVEAGLLAEMEMELQGLPIPADAWQIIRQPSDLDNLRTINVISYERLRLPVDGRASEEDVEQGGEVKGKPKAKPTLRMRETYAGRLRRRCGVVVSDEGDLLSNPESQQSRCLWHLSAKKRYVLSGTPIASYPRDVLPILAYTAGDGTAAQPYGWRGGYLESRWITSMTYTQRGIDAFRERFVVLDWSTREFDDGLIEGAKREIPRIGDLAGYRELLGPHIKRRIAQEPEVAACVKMPKPDYKTTVLPWDEEHLSFYLKVAEEFQEFYMKLRGEAGRKGSNLIAILARIQAVSFAQDFPQHGVRGFGAYGRLTSKQRYVINRVVQLTKEGHKTIIYAENPGVLELIHKHLAAVDIDSVLFHGDLPIKRRTRELNQRFRFGDSPNLCASLGVTQKGLNLWQADRVLMLSRSWSATVEAQAIGRPLRPQQKRQVEVERIHLDGGIDIYKDQLVTFKADCAQAGLDWGEPETDELEFLHLDTILHRFCEDLAALKGVKRWDLRQALAA